MARRFVGILLGASLAACAGQPDRLPPPRPDGEAADVGPAPAAPASTPLALRTVSDLPAVRPDTVFAPLNVAEVLRSSLPEPKTMVFDAAAAAAGLAPLSRTPLAADESEVRVWTGHSLSYPRSLYRVRQRGGVTEGELILYWKWRFVAPGLDSLQAESGVWEMLEGKCGERRRMGDLETCRVRFTREPDWAAVVRTAEASGLRTLPDEDEMRRERGLGYRIVLDGSSMTVEVRAGGQYRSYHYRCPRESPEAPEYGQAHDILHAFHAVQELAETPNQLRVVHRGKWVSGPRRSEFRPCGSQNALRMYDLRIPPLDAEGRPAFPPPDSLTTRRYVEVRGFLGRDPVPPRRGRAREYERRLTMVELVEERPWDPALCAAATAAR